ncbi:MAG: hypothetical protein JW832_04690 [Deltaproteobacteria bacterium]|nr:hypothetical protein [Deltaproteobacteria bacterium]
MKESLIFEDLEKIAVQHDIRITTANLKKYAYYMKSGLCRVRGEYRLIIDKHLHLSEKIDVMIDALQHFDVEASSLDPAVRRLLEKKTKDGRQGLFHPETAATGESMVTQAGSLQ